jgi:hypothetical protein
MTLDCDISHNVASRIMMVVLTKGAAGLPNLKEKEDKHDNALDQNDDDLEDSLREFLTTHEPKRIPEQIVTIACFLKTRRKKASFTKEDLIKCFEEAEEGVPKNLVRDIKWTVKIGWIAPKTDQADAYYLTKTGQEAVNQKFPAEIRKKTKISKGGRKKKNPAKASPVK